VRNGPADRVDLPEHGSLISRLNRQRMLGREERINDREGCGQRHLEAHFRGRMAPLPRGQEILVRRARLPCITQFRKTNIGRRDAFGKLKRQKARGLVGSARIRFEEG